MPDPLLADDLVSQANESGFACSAAANTERLVRRLDRTAWFPQPRTGTEVLLPALKALLPDPLTGSFLACALPYACDEPDDVLPPRVAPEAAGTVGKIAAFARYDYYQAAAKALLKLSGRLGVRRSGRVFVNSRVPEKLIACASGLGRYRKNRLLYADGCGSRFVIGLLYLPFQIEETGDDGPLASPDEFCGACDICRRACPVDALGPGEGAGLPGCLKTRSDSLEIWDEVTRLAWGRRLYGCDTCQAVCPKNADLPPPPTVRDGAIGGAIGGAVGPGVELPALLSSSEAEIRARFRKTALGLKWILPEALLRNALCAAGNSGAPALLASVQRHLGSTRPLLSDMARWAEARLKRNGE